MAGSSEFEDQVIITVCRDRIGLGPLPRDLVETLHLRWGNDLAAGMMQGAVGFATSASSQRYYDNRTAPRTVDSASGAGRLHSDRSYQAGPLG